MPRPTSSTTVGRPDLKSVLTEYIEGPSDFIGTHVLPTFSVERQAADYPVIPIEALLSIPNTSRRPRGEYNRSDFEFENDSYNCVENGWEEPVDDVEERLYSRFFDVEKVSAMRALGIIRRVQEKRIADMLFNASNFTANAVTNEWDDGANATPITDVKAGHLAIKNATGLSPNTMVISYSTFLDLGVCAQIIDRIKYTNPDVERGNIDHALLAKAFEVDRVLVGGGRYNSADKGLSASLSSLWSNEYAMLCVTSASQDVQTPCVGRTFLWTQDSPENEMVESYREEKTRSDIIRVRQHTDEELILTAAAYLLSNITT